MEYYPVMKKNEVLICATTWINFKKSSLKPWLVWLDWLECHAITGRLRVQFPIRAHVWVASSSPGPNVYNPRSRCGKPASAGR